MNIIEIISKKRDKKILSKEEINYFINAYTKGEITENIIIRNRTQYKSNFIWKRNRKYSNITKKRIWKQFW